MAFGQILNEIARAGGPLADRIVTTAPDVTVSTNLGGWVNRRGLHAREALADTFKAERIPSTFTWEFSPAGQHLELGIAEANLMTMLSALGLSHAINGVRLLPVGTVYDPFVLRAADQLNYACYQDARFILVGTPSGVTLAPEGGAHQSIAPPLVGMAQDGLAAFEPAFVDELAVIMRWAFDYLQRDGERTPDPRTWLRDATGGSVYLRLSTRPVEQPGRPMTPALAQEVVDGGYWLRPPEPSTEVVVAYTGVVAPEAVAAVGRMAEARRAPALLAITSADRLNAGWSAAQRAREAGDAGARAQVERLMAAVPRDAGDRHRLRRPPGGAGLARRGRRPPDAGARGRALRPDRADRRPLPPLRHRRRRHPRRRGGAHPRPPDRRRGGRGLSAGRSDGGGAPHSLHSRRSGRSVAPPPKRAPDPITSDAECELRLLHDPRRPPAHQPQADRLGAGGEGERDVGADHQRRHQHGVLAGALGGERHEAGEDAFVGAGAGAAGGVAHERAAGMPGHGAHQFAELGGEAEAGGLAVPRHELARHAGRTLRPGAPEPQAVDHLALERRQLGQAADRRGAGMPRLGAHFVRISLPCRVMRRT